MGFLDEDRLPAGSPPLVIEAHGSRPVGLWFPDSGKLLQVPDQMVVTARNLENCSKGIQPTRIGGKKIVPRAQGRGRFFWSVIGGILVGGPNHFRDLGRGENLGVPGRRAPGP